ncbi:MAG: PcfJ domain-containing protein [Clostridia bacterium]|nr:PcfJ domain-containing protein [Clostridia bacterium]
MRQVLDFAYGYRVETDCEEFTPEKILNDRHKYRAAMKRKGVAYLYADYVVCPYCGAKMSLCGNVNEAISDDFLLEWADSQVSLFEDEEEKVLSLAGRVVCHGNVKCGVCDRILKPAHGSRSVEFEVRHGKLTVKSRILDVGEIFDTQVWCEGVTVNFSPNLCEVLTFNFKKGRVHISLFDGDLPLVTRDITQSPQKIEGTMTDGLFAEHPAFKEKLVEFFRVYAGEFAFAYIDFNALFLMTRYIGYDAAFFDYVPFFKGTSRIHPLFRNREKRLHDAKALPEIFDRSTLPKRKALRRIMFSKPGYFFYLDEMCKMYEILGNYDVFIRFISKPGAFDVFATLNRFPVVEEYLRLICRVNPHNKVRAILENSGVISSRGLEYAAMSDAMKRRYERNLAKRGSVNDFAVNHASMPIVRESKIYDTVIDGFDFHWLRSTNEYIRAGKELSNCLSEMAINTMHVVGVMRNGRFVAAIEIKRDRHIAQMRGPHNRDIENPKLLDAIEKWRNMFGLEEGGFDFIGDAFDDEDIFPF